MSREYTAGTDQGQRRIAGKTSEKPRPFLATFIACVECTVTTIENLLYETPNNCTEYA